MIDKSNYKEFFTPGMRVVVLVEELVDGQPKLLTHGFDGNATFVGYTLLGAATFMIIDKTKGTGRKTQIEETLAINTNKIVYATPYNGPPKV